MEKKKYIIWIVIGAVILMMAAFQETKAGIELTDSLAVTGFLRYELGIHVAEKNPANIFQRDNNDFNLSRTFLQTEWTYKPSDVFKLYANVRVTGDQTYHFDDELSTYNAFPVDVPDYDWTMMKASNDDFRAEVWELYVDLNLRDLWLRIGRQQIAWGEMIGGRILDAVNSLDRSWNFLFEPEEFENIRIPNWCIRGIYNVRQVHFGWLRDLTIEAFLNPGDVVPTIEAEVGAPFRLAALPPFFRIHDKDNRGKAEYGVRLGGMVGQFYATLNYMKLYNDASNLTFRGLTPDPIRGIPLLAALGDFTRYAMLLSAEHKSINLYGISLNYAWGEPMNLVATFEGVWTPNQPYGDAGGQLPAIKDQGTWLYAIKFDRPTRVFPPSFLHASMMALTFQFTQTVVEGDEDRILGIGNSKVDKTVQKLSILFRQPLWHNNYDISFQGIYDTDDAYYLKPSFSYIYGDNWYFDLFAVFLGGSERRPGTLGSTYWADTVYGRVTFQF